MSNDKKTRVMTIKGFLHKSGGKVSATAFLQAHREFLLTGELAAITAPILSRIDAGCTLPTPGLDEVRHAVLSHHLLSESLKAEAALLQQGQEASATVKTWEVTCYDAKGNILTRVNAKGQTVEVQESFALQQRASEWCDRRLVHDCDGTSFGVIVHIPTGLEAVVMRGDAFARVFPKTASAATKKMGKGDGKLSFGVKAHQSRATFSHG